MAAWMLWFAASLVSSFLRPNEWTLGSLVLASGCVLAIGWLGNNFGSIERDLRVGTCCRCGDRMLVSLNDCRAMVFCCDACEGE